MFGLRECAVNFFAMERAPYIEFNDTAIIINGVGKNIS